MGRRRYRSLLFLPLDIEPTVVIELSAPESILIRRLTGRLFCCHCGHLYNSYSLLPAHKIFCDHDGMLLMQNSNDAPAKAWERIREYRRCRRTMHICERYDKYVQVDACGSPNEVLAKIERAIEVNGS